MSKATIYDVAGAARVSLATVSRAINNPEKVKPETRERVLRVIEELDNYVASGSQITIVADIDGISMQIAELKKSVQNQKIDFIKGDINDKATLVNLKPETYDHLILLSYMDIDLQESDAKTLICLLHLRNLSEKVGKDFSIVSEMLDIRNRDLGVVAKADDFIISHNLISLMLSQLSENKDLKKVYAILTEHKLMLGMGHFYAVRPLIDMNIPQQPGVLRISFVHYTRKEDINQLITGLKAALDN